jgi:hypothetical protein
MSATLAAYDLPPTETESHSYHWFGLAQAEVYVAQEILKAPDYCCQPRYRDHDPEATSDHTFVETSVRRRLSSFGC